MSIVSEIKKSTSKVFRRMYMKRRMPGGDYESDWQEIPNKYITKWGTVSYSIDDVLPDWYKFSGSNIELSNRDGYFATTEDDKSFFYGALTIPKTFVKIEAGYEDASGNEYPTDPTLFIGLIGDEVVYDNDATVKMKLDHVSKIFQDFPADQLRIGTYDKTMTAANFVYFVQYHHDTPDYTSSSIFIFQKYISSGAWYYTSGSNRYVIDTTTSLQSLKVWDLFKKLANAENSVMYVDRSGNFHFEPKSVASGTAVFHFSGIGDSDRTYGHNIMEKLSVDTGIDNIYNRIKIKYGEEDTITSYYILNETWQWGDSSSSFLYGIREYEYENTFLTVTTAQTIANTVYDEYSWPKKKISFSSKFVPHLDLNDYVTITYKKNRYVGDSFWGTFQWNVGKWGKRYGYNINLDNAGCKITELKHNLDKMNTDVILREI
jgi:hypothetical protein